MKIQKDAIVIVIVIVIAVLGGFLAYKYYSATDFSKNEVQNSEVQNSNEPQNFSESKVETNPETGWRIYRDNDVGFEVSYPVYGSEFFSIKSFDVIIGKSNINEFGCFAGNSKYLGVFIDDAEDKNILINGIDFCMSKSGASGNGRSYPSYFYTTQKDGNYITTAMVFNVATCIAIKDSEKSQLCQEYFKTPKNPPDIAREIVSTFKFTK